ncbi:separase [Trypanosoma rangeli]|uniref:separase n=1 Tax=Trypanosoma rangeli TaxID=5698 RepID=A0A3R7NMW1_TRYRA|nr:separase [Trypanosoma rangeli]RNF08809.1 separase [Trypanosoma rangeli]|eukprot:RNF08809.1 separase [Trypanosoma rangeli]
MRPAAVGEILLQKATSPLVDESELQAVLAAAKAAAATGAVSLVGDAWRTVRLLASAARCTLQAGRGDLALPLIKTAFELCPEPFRRLASLLSEQGAEDGCALARSMLAVASLQDGERDIPAVVCTALMVWQGALTATASKSSCVGGFLRFSHVAGQIFTELARDTSTLEKISACWLYNTLAFADRVGNAKTVSFYLMQEIYNETHPPDLREITECELVCAAGKNACLRMGLHGSEVVAKWDRLCTALYAEGCALLHAAQEEVRRRASRATSILRETFAMESTYYLSEFRRPLHLSPEEATLLREAAVGKDLCVPRETFTLLRVACALRHFSGGGEHASAGGFPVASVSSVVAIALRHRYTDIAAELLRAGSSPRLGDGALLLWGRELESLLGGAAKVSGGRGVNCTARERVAAHAHAHAAEPGPLLHEISQEWCATDVLHLLATAEALEDMLPAGLTMIRGDKALGRQLLGDKVVPSFVLDGLSRLITRLVDEGDLPLARCFLPLLAGICERLPSQSNLLVTLHAIAAFAQGCFNDDADERWTAVVSALLPLLPPRLSGMTPPYRQTKSVVVGRTFSTRRCVFDALGGTPPLGTAVQRHCQLQVRLTGDCKGVRLVRSGSVEGATPWEKILPVGKALLDVVANMLEIEVQNRRHLGAAPCKDAPALEEEEEEPSRATEAVSSSEVERQSGQARAEWWRQRYAFDGALQKVVAKMQSDEIFGCWRVAMCGDLSPSCLLELEKVAAKLLEGIEAPAHHMSDVTLLLAGLPFLVAHRDAGSHVLFSPSHGSAEGTCASCDAVLHSLSAALEMELLKHGIAAASTDVFAVSRDACLCALTNMWNAMPAPRSSNSGHRDVRALSRTPLYLVLDNELHSLPFEGMDVLRAGNVARVPTPTFISTSGVRSVFFRGGLVYCVIDPAGVMPKTSKRLLPVCQRSGWTTNTHAMSSGQLMQELYSSRAKLYVYIGHGRGESLVHRGELYERFPEPDEFPAVFLMGCSSAHMESGSSHDSYGMPYAFLHAGCPLFLGCLWHVTDGEIDRLTKRLLLLLAGDDVDDGLGPLPPPRSVGEALALARRACKLPFLTGCAAVLYGINLSLQHDEADGKETTL